jgi:hypothetical protein
MIDYFSADNNSSFNENTRYPSSVNYKSWHFRKSDNFNLPGNRGNKFYSINVIEIELKEIDLHRKFPYLVQKIVCIHGKQLKKWSEVD